MATQKLPKVEWLVQQVRDSLDEVAASNQKKSIRHKNWFRLIVEGIAKRVRKKELDSYAKGRFKGCGDREWLFDYCAVRKESRSISDNERFTAYAAIVGEVQWTPKGVDKDFEKLFMADAMVCFMAFEPRARDDIGEELKRLERAARRHRRYCKKRGNRQPAVFLLSGHVKKDRQFIHREVS